MKTIIFLVMFTIWVDLTSAAGVDDLCPSELVLITDRKYLKVFEGSCFYFSLDSKKIYTDARVKCDKYGGSLAIPKTQYINNFLVDSAKDLDFTGFLWIGLSDMELEGAWKWEDGSTFGWSNFDWANGGLGKGYEDCIALDAKKGYWHDFDCTDKHWYDIFTKPEKAFICQFQNQDPSVVLAG